MSDARDRRCGEHDVHVTHSLFLKIQKGCLYLHGCRTQKRLALPERGAAGADNYHLTRADQPTNSPVHPGPRSVSPNVRPKFPNTHLRNTFRKTGVWIGLVHSQGEYIALCVER